MRTRSGSVQSWSLIGLAVLAAGVGAVFLLGDDRSRSGERGDDATAPPGAPAGGVLGPHLDAALAAVGPAPLPPAPAASELAGEWTVLDGSIACGSGGDATVMPAPSDGSRALAVSVAGGAVTARLLPGDAVFALRASGDAWSGPRTDRDGAGITMDVRKRGAELAVEVRAREPEATTWGFRAARGK
ncbi:MAG: hypothetical protein HMLKMBBP_03081 [Planctomycetes bacterium]|nr:hypothetical protein [Planctomycetota bacterium]